MPRNLASVVAVLLAALFSAAPMTSIGSAHELAVVGGHKACSCGKVHSSVVRHESAKPCEEPTPQYIERTVYVPECVTETHTVNVEQEKCVEKQREVTVYECVREEVEKTRTYTVHVPEKRVKVEHYNVKVPSWEIRTKEYNVKVPVQVKKTEKRTVYKSVPVKKYRTVKVDEGCWESCLVPETQGCCQSNCCGYRSHCGLFGRSRCCEPTNCSAPKGCQVYKVWVPKIVEKQVEETAYQQVPIEVDHEYVVTEYHTEVRQREYKVCVWNTEERTRECEYVVHVPEQREEKYTVVNYKDVPKQVMETYMEITYETVAKDIEVQVQKMVPKTVRVRVDQCEPCNAPPTSCCW